MDLNDPLFTRSLPHKRNKRLGKGMVSVDNGSNSIAPHVQLYRMQLTLHSQGERGKKRKEKDTAHIFCHAVSSRALYEYSWNFNALPDDDDIPIHEFGPTPSVVVIPNTGRPRCRRRRFREPWHANRTCLKFAESSAEY